MVLISTTHVRPFSGVNLPALLFTELVSSRLSLFGDVLHLLWPLLTPASSHPMLSSVAFLLPDARETGLPRKGRELPPCDRVIYPIS